MKEKIESINFNELSLEDAQNLLNELLTYDGEEFKEMVTTVIDAIEFSIVSEDVIPVSIDTIFNNERVKVVVDEILSEYSEEEQ